MVVYVQGVALPVEDHSYFAVNRLSRPSLGEHRPASAVNIIVSSLQKKPVERAPARLVVRTLDAARFVLSHDASDHQVAFAGDQTYLAEQLARAVRRIGCRRPHKVRAILAQLRPQKWPRCWREC